MIMQAEGGKPAPQTLRELVERGDLQSVASLRQSLGDRFLLILPVDGDVASLGEGSSFDIAQTLPDDTVDLNAPDSLFNSMVYPLPPTSNTQVMVTVGRQEEYDVYLSDISVSGFHASLRIGPGDQICVQDMGSTNGTFVDDVAVPAQGDGPPTDVEPGYSLRFGNVRTVYMDGESLHRLLMGPSKK